MPDYEPIEPDFFRNPNTEDPGKKPDKVVLIVFIAFLLFTGTAYSYYVLRDGVLPPIPTITYSPSPFNNVIVPDNSLPQGTETPFMSPSFPDEEVCIQVITPARNPATGEVRDFPTPCDVPEGWTAL